MTSKTLAGSKPSRRKFWVVLFRGKWPCEKNLGVAWSWVGMVEDHGGEAVDEPEIYFSEEEARKHTMIRHGNEYQPAEFEL